MANGEFTATQALTNEEAFKQYVVFNLGRILQRLDDGGEKMEDHEDKIEEGGKEIVELQGVVKEHLQFHSHVHQTVKLVVRSVGGAAVVISAAVGLRALGVF